MLNLVKRIKWEVVAALGLCVVLWALVIWRVAGAFGG